MRRVLARMDTMQSISAVRNLKGKRVIVRVDMNVPRDERGAIADDFRIRKSLETIRHILKKGGSVFIISHWGEPNGRERAYSLQPIAERISQLLKQKVVLISDPLGEDPKRYSSAVLLSENIRFWEGEHRNAAPFAKRLARWGSFYVNDAFAASHRHDASIVGLPRLLPSYAGMLLQREVAEFGKLFKKPKRPFLVLMGGGKISTKLPYIKRLVKIADKIILGGGLFNTLLIAKGEAVGKSLIEPEALGEAKRLLKEKHIILPIDVLVANARSDSAKFSVKEPHEVAAGEYILDVGPASVSHIKEELSRARTVLWNGPLGYIELKKSRASTVAVLRALSHVKGSVEVGGGDLALLFDELNLKSRRIHVSTGGGALLHFVAFGTLPGIEALKQ